MTREDLNTVALWLGISLSWLVLLYFGYCA